MNSTDLPVGSIVLTESERNRLVEEEAYEQGTLVAQIFSGIFFSGVAGWLTVSNGTRLAFVQRAALEKRLTTCCFLNTYVGFFSAFFNYFQLTAVDDLVLPNSGNFTLDLARPFEWLMTCPLMQLSLVLMGGAKIPEYRRYLMPGFSVSILMLGTIGAFLGDSIFAIKIVCWTISCCIFVVMVYFNRMQIIEYSNGEECLIRGDSEFRKATVLLIATWSPFPLWYVVSPEGLGLIDNVLIVQVGWAFLNIVAKFSFIFYVQRMKDMYCNRLKTKRELQPAKAFNSGGMGGMRPGSMSPPLDGDFSGAIGGYMTAAELEVEDHAKKKAQLSAVVVETMNFLGMAQHTDRFLKLLDRAEMHNIFEVEALTKERCCELQLPYDLVSALQRRLRVWKLEMVDDAEMGLDKGEEFYIRKNADGMDGMDGGYMPGMMPGMMPVFDPEEHNAKLTQIEELLRQKLDTQETMLHESRSNGELVDKSMQGMMKQFQDAMEAMEGRILERIGAGGGRSDGFVASDTSAATSRSEVRAFETRITAKIDEVQTVTEQQRRHELHTLEARMGANMEQQIALLATKLDVCCQKVEACNQKADLCSQKVDSSSAEQIAKMLESMSRFNEKVDECFKEANSQSDALSKSLDAGITKLGGNATSILESVEALSVQTRSGIDLLTQKAEAIQASQTKLATSAEDHLRQRFSELESSMTCREEEHEATAKRRFEELLRVAPTKKVDEIISQVSKLGERVDQSSEMLGSALTSEIQSAIGRVMQKTDTSQSSLARLLADQDASAQRRSDEAIEQAQASGQAVLQRVGAMDTALQKRVDALQEVSQVGTSGIESIMAKRFDELTQVTQGFTDKATQKTVAAIDSLGSGVSKRIDDAIQKSAADSAYSGAMTAERRAEKAVETLEVSNRTELQSVTSNLLERFDDMSASQARKSTEREERNMRRIEELLELMANRATQKTEDVGIDMKKELHGFAKRLNSKIPFM